MFENSEHRLPRTRHCSCISLILLTLFLEDKPYLLPYHPIHEEPEVERSGNLLNVTPLVGLNSQYLKINILSTSCSDQSTFSGRVASPGSQKRSAPPLVSLKSSIRGSQRKSHGAHTYHPRRPSWAAC